MKKYLAIPEDLTMDLQARDLLPEKLPFTTEK
jgi:hypothetical protein